MQGELAEELESVKMEYKNLERLYDIDMKELKELKERFGSDSARVMEVKAGETVKIGEMVMTVPVDTTIKMVEKETM